MTPQQIAAAREEAAQVLSGFRTLKTKQARDVVSLCNHVGELTLQVSRLQSLLEAVKEPPTADSLFSSIFKNR